jgi:carbamoyltransferase
MKKYCGYSEFFHDAGIAFVMENGDIDFATHSERYTRIKNDPMMHLKLYDMMDTADHVTYYEDYYIRNSTAWHSEYKGGLFNYISLLNQQHYDALVHDAFIPHHVSHAANGFYTRPWESYEDTLILSVDGAGEVQSMVIYNHKFEILDEWEIPRSLGYMYSDATRHLGFKHLEDEYVVMGMSAYGEPTMGPELYDWFYTIGINTIDAWKSGTYTKYSNTLELLRVRHGRENFASSVQWVTEQVFLDLALKCKNLGAKKLIVTGGCAQNIVAMSMIRPLFEDMHIPVAPTDAGSALGAAAYSWAHETGNETGRLNWKSPYLGHDMSVDLDPKKIAQYLVDHKVCGVANGKAEFGPRALGNRSLLADVRTNVKDTVNKIKKRQEFRPFAPAILSEHADQYFEGYMGEYMQYTCKAKHDYKSVIHVDGTSRVQLVKPDCTSIIRPILEEYYEMTGVPMLLNTSLNVRGKPMVNTHRNAMGFQEQYKIKVFHRG